MREPFAVTTAVSSTLHQLDILAGRADAGLSVLEYDRIFGVLDKDIERCTANSHRGDRRVYRIGVSGDEAERAGAELYYRGWGRPLHGASFG